MSDRNILTAAIEAMLFAAPGPVPLERLAEILGAGTAIVADAVADLARLYEQPGRGVCLRKVAGGYQVFSRPEFAPDVERLVQPERARLSRAALETLAIVTYRQPVTRADVEEVRGVQSGHTLRTLEQSGLIAATGRADAPGRPIQYSTTSDLLSLLGIDSLDELPPLSLPAEEDRGLTGRGG